MLLLSVPVIAFGRIRPVWSYEQIHDKSDLVVIARPISSTPLEEKTTLPNIAPAIHVVGIQTRFEVRLVLKGYAKTKTICLHHYAFQNPSDAQLGGAPELVSFDPKHPACYLMFLRQVGAGRFEPTTGQTDPAADCIMKLPGGAR